MPLVAYTRLYWKGAGVLLSAAKTSVPGNKPGTE
jgi:hypothetical protein